MSTHEKQRKINKRISLRKKVGLYFGDLLGGIAGTAVALPQSMGLGLVLFTAIGLDASHGAMAGLLGAAILSLSSGLVGGTRGMISAPNGPVTMLLVASLTPLFFDGIQGPALLLSLAIILVLAGLLQIGFGFAGGGQLVKYIPFPAVAGLVTGIGILMILSQVQSLMGGVHEDAVGFWRSMPIFTAFVTFAGTKLADRYIPKFPGIICGFVAGIACFHFLAQWMPTQIPTAWVLGEIPSMQLIGIIPEIPAVRELPILHIFTAALTVALLASVDCLLTAVVADGRTGERHNSRRELAAQGVAQIVVGLLGGLGGGGTKGSTLVAIDSGGRRWPAVVAGLVFLSLMLFMAPVGQFLPISVLSGVIFSVGIGLIDTNILRWTQRRRLRMDAIVAIAVIGTTVTVDLLAGLIVGVVGSVLLFIHGQLSLPVLHDRANGKQRRSLKERGKEERHLLDKNGDRIVCVELRGNLFFGTADRLFTELMQDLERPVWMVINMRRVQHIDTSAMYILRQMAARLQQNGGTMVYANVFKHTSGTRKIHKAFRKLGKTVDLPKVKTFGSTDAALEYAEDELLRTLDSRFPVRKHRVELADNNLCIDLGPDTVAILESILRPLSLEPKDMVFSQGEPGNAVYLMLTGEVETRLPTGRYHYKRISKIGPGGYFGNVGFLRPGPRSTTAVVIHKADMLVLDRSALDALERNGEHVAAMRILDSIVRTVTGQLRWTRAELARIESG